MNAQPPSPPELLARSTIILCEADEALVESFQLMLEGTGRLIVAPTLEMTTAVLREIEPHLLIIDVDGQPTILPQLERLTSRYPKLKILLIAGEFSLDFQQAAVQLGITRFQTKPWISQHFTERVDTLLRGYALNPMRHILKLRTAND